MKKGRIGYALLMGACRLAGFLPDRALYGGLSPFIYVVLYRLIGYRVAVVRRNLENAFPEKSEAERKDIERRFYHHLADVFVDTIKLATISQEEILARLKWVNVAGNENCMRGKNWIAAMSHYGSWELTITYSLFSDHRILAVYHPLHSAVFERYYRKVRTRFETKPVPMNEIFRDVVRARASGSQRISVALLADQTPAASTIKHWFRFLNQDTAFFTGMEKMAIKFGMPVIFLHIEQVKRGWYDGDLQLIYDGKEEVAEYEITQRYVDRLESMIREKPYLWMWSHRRWKHTPESVAAAREDRERSVVSPAAEKQP